MASTRKEIAKSIKTLLVMLQSIRNQQVTITLRNDSIVKGTIIKVDDNMNIELENASVQEDPFYSTKDCQVENKTLANLSESKLREKFDCQSIETRDVPLTEEETQSNTIVEMDEETEQYDHFNNTSANKEDEERDEDDEDESELNGINLYDYLIVKGSRIRHIDLPTDYDLLATTKREIERIRGRRKQWSKRDIVKS